VTGIFPILKAPYSVAADSTVSSVTAVVSSGDTSFSLVVLLRLNTWRFALNRLRAFETPFQRYRRKQRTAAKKSRMRFRANLQVFRRSNTTKEKEVSPEETTAVTEETVESAATE
jgi:hypothetical protein